MINQQEIQSVQPETGTGESEQDREVRHLVNRLRLEFRAASTLELERAVYSVLQQVPPASSPEKVMTEARKILAIEE
jgi:hypothetical protein